ncbi:MAG TPA: hypothetical protein VJK54_11230 [Chthoniobacterales bacterium]|nr:hypothetical protein [Chthoniobacterales bacterium]
MDPKIVEGVEEGIEGLMIKEKPKTPSVKLPPITNTNPNEIPTTTPVHLTAIQNLLPDIHEAKIILPSLNRPNTGTATRNILQEKTVTVQNPFQQTVQLNGTTSEQTAHLVQSLPPEEVSSERLQKNLLQIEVDRTLIETWEAMITEMKEKEAIALAVGKTGEANYRKGAGNGLCNAIEMLEKAIKAESTGKLEKARKYREAVELYKCCTEAFTKAAIAHTAEKTEGANCWQIAGVNFAFAADKLQEVIQAEGMGRIYQANNFKKTVEEHKQKAEKFKQEAEVQVKKEEERIAEILAQESLATEEELRIAQEQILLGIEDDKKLIEIWKTMQMEMKEKKTIASTVGKTEESTHWQNAIMKLFWAAEKLEEAIEAERIKNPGKAHKLREEAKQYNSCVEPYVQAAKSYEQEKIEEGECWGRIGDGLSKTANALERVIDAELAGKSEMASKWNKVVKFNKCSVEAYKRGVRAYGEGKTEEAQSWHNTGNGFYSAGRNLETAIKKEIDGSPEIAIKYCELAEQYTRSIDFYTQATKAYEQGKIEEGTFWNNAGEGFDKASRYLEAAIRAEIDVYPEEAKKYREIAEQYERSVEPYTQAAKAYMEGKTDEGTHWNNAGEGCNNVAEKLTLAIRKEISGSLDEAKTLREEAKNQKQTAEAIIKKQKERIAERLCQPET